MPPKVKNSKEEILQTALKLVREQGEQGFNARALAKALDCSTQPLYFNFGSMENIRSEVIRMATDLYKENIEKEIAKGKYSEYEATEIAYIRFARKETALFKLLFMGEHIPTAEESAADLAHFAEMIHKETGIPKTEAVFFHLEMWACVHGLATMIATNRLAWDGKLISRLLSDLQEGLLVKFEPEEIE